MFFYMEANYGDFCKKRNCVIQPVCKEFRYFSETANGIKAGKNCNHKKQRDAGRDDSY